MLQIMNYKIRTYIKLYIPRQAGMIFYFETPISYVNIKGLLGKDRILAQIL